MSYTDQQMLDDVNAAIQKRLQGDAYNGYSEGPDRFEGESIESLYKLRERLTRLINSTGSIFKPFSPVRDSF